MYISDIAVKDFRNLKEQKIQLSNRVNVLYGDNAQGKTNLIEAVYFCANGRSMRGVRDGELIAWGKPDAHVQIHLIKNSVKDRVDIHLKAEGVKGAAVNGLPVKRLGELMQNVYVVVFSPEDLSLIKGGPGERRRFADVQLCRLSSVYYYDLQQYYRVLKQRNYLLKEIARKRAEKDELLVWDSQLSDFGGRIIHARESYIERLSGIARALHSELSGGEDLCLKYKPSSLADELAQRLVNNTNKDIILGSTSVGAHKDDILFLVNGKDARIFASQGQQRSACLSAVLAELELIRSEKGEDPILLLDDVLSELDEKRRSFLFKLIGSMQTIITCTGISEIVERVKLLETGNDTRMFHVKNGFIEPPIKQ